MDELKFLQYLAQFDKEIEKVYNRFVQELASIGVSVTDTMTGGIFSFANFPEIQQKLSEAMKTYNTAMKNMLVNGMTGAINASFANTTEALGKYSILEEKAVESLRETCKLAYIASRMKPDTGLSLSQRVWNYTQQSKAEFEIAVSDIMTEGLSKGISAEELGRRVRGRLQNPDAMYRRYHLKKTMSDGTKKDIVEWRKRTIDADGKVHFMSTDIEHPGAGVYRSSRKNALRMAATEINAAYRYADCTRWQNEPFVIGIRIRLSDNHTCNGKPFVDMCDNLYGDYPKWMLWRGWHVKCRCSASSILVGEEEFRQIMALPKEQRKNYVSPNLIKDMPDNYYEYIEKNRDRIERSIERGTQPWWISDNYIDGDINSGFIALRQKTVAPGGIVLPGGVSAPGAIQQTQRKDGVILGDDDVTKILQEDRTLYTAEQLKNLDEIERLLGVSRGTSMSWEEANKGAENPLYNMGGQYTTNCQTATIVHELRRRGFNVTAKGAVDGIEKLYAQGFDWEKRFLTPSGKKIHVENAESWAKVRGINRIMRKHLDAFLIEKMKEDGRYEIYAEWEPAKFSKKKMKTQNGAHVFMAEVKNGKIIYFDPQTGSSGSATDWYFDFVKNQTVCVMRIDDKIINPLMAKALNAKDGIVDTTDFIITKPKTRIEIIAEERHAKRDEQAIRDANEIRHAMMRSKKPIREIFNMLNDVAEREGYSRMGYNDIFSINRDTDGKITSIDVKESLLPRPAFDAYIKYKDVLAKLKNIDIDGLGSKRTKYIKEYIEDIKRKAILSIRKNTATYKQLPTRTRAKVRELLAEREEIRKLAEERRNRMAAAAPQAKEIDPTKATSYQELVEMLGDDMPPALSKYEESVKRNNWLSSDIERKRTDIERKLKKFFKEVVTGYGHFTEVDNVIDDTRIITGHGIWNTQIEVLEGKTSRTDYYHKERNGYARWAYTPYDTQSGTSKWLWKPGEYYRCAAVLDGNDPTHWYTDLNSGYGGGKGRNVMILFRNDRVVTTFTAHNSLGSSDIPSLTCDPKVVSLDRRGIDDIDAPEYNSVSQIKQGRYLEAQVFPFKSRNGVLGANEIKAIILPEHPNKILGASKGIWDKWYEAHVDIYYYDRSRGKVELYRAGKLDETPEERAKRIEARNKKRISDRNKALKEQGLTPTEKIQQLLAERAKMTADARKNAQMLIDVAESIENADLSFDALRKKMNDGNYYGAKIEAERLRAEYKKIQARKDAIRDLIPDVDKYHKRFTIKELEETYKVVKNQIKFYEQKYGGDPDRLLSKLIDQREYTIDPTQFSYGKGKTRHKLWEIARDGYIVRTKQVVAEIRRKKAVDALGELEKFKTTSTVFKKILKDAKALIDANDFKAAMKKIEEGNLKRMALETKKLSSAVKKLGESSRVIFDSDVFTQARKDAAKWFTKKEYGTALEAFKACDDYMSQYAEEIWKTLSKEEKMILWLYTDGSKYISEEMLGTYCLQIKSAIDGSLRNGLADANVITSIIEKAPALKDDMWMQSGKSIGAFNAIFDTRIDSARWVNEAELKSLIGKEGRSDIFMSCHGARSGAFTKNTNTGSANDVILSIYMPQGTKGIYCEPFASFGDERNPGKRGIQAFDWDGKKRQELPSDQVEWLLQRGSKFRITKAYKANGKIYIDVDLIEQLPMDALDASLFDSRYRSIRTYRKKEEDIPMPIDYEQD